MNAYTARIESPLPDGTFGAIVAGKTITLSLPQGAESGDSLELVVIDRAPQFILAGRAEFPSAQTPGATLSRAAQLIGTLLSRSKDMPPQPVLLGRGEPILPSPPQSARTLAPLLQAVLGA